MNRLQLIEQLIKEHGLKEKDRSRGRVYKRYYLYNELRALHFTLEDIGVMFGGKHYATVLHGLRQHEELKRYADYTICTKNLKEFLDGKQESYYTVEIPDLKQDVNNARTFAQFKRIQRHLKLGKYEESPKPSKESWEKIGEYIKNKLPTGTVVNE